VIATAGLPTYQRTVDHVMFCRNESATRLVRVTALGVCVGDCEPRADTQRGELIDRIAPCAPVRELVFLEALGHPRMPLARFRPDHRAGIELPAIDRQRAAEAAADVER
jgi:hypothetical protein